MDKTYAEELQKKGAVFYNWNLPRLKLGLLGPNESLVRLVTSFATEVKEVDQLIELLS